MKVKALQLKNFRTYSNLEISFRNRLCFITGRNATGKTNIVEAISVLSNGRSFRGAGDEEMLRTGENGYYISCRYEKNGSDHQLEYGYDSSTGKSRKKIQLNGKAYPSRSALIGNLVSVIFNPADILIVNGGSALRRRFIDLVISNQNRDYFENLLQYNKALKQRNILLKSIRNNKNRLSDLDPWDVGLSGYGEKIMNYRKGFIQEFNLYFEKALERISESRDRIEIVLSSGDENGISFEEKLKKNRMRDVAAGFTTSGPHRHTIYFMNDEKKDAANYLSQGQKRSLVLSLRIAQFYYLKQKLNYSPVLIIDDVIRELDAYRRSAFVALLHECGQALFTTPDMDGLEQFLSDMQSEYEIYQTKGGGEIERIHGN